jgi:hypothetical protein
MCLLSRKVLEAAREFGGFSRVWDTLGTFFYVSFVPGAHRLSKLVNLNQIREKIKKGSSLYEVILI